MAKLTRADVCLVCDTPVMYPRHNNVSRANMIIQCEVCGGHFHQDCIVEAVRKFRKTGEPIKLSCDNPQCPFRDRGKPTSS